MPKADELSIEPPQFPPQDRSGELGQRLLGLLGIAIRRALPNVDPFLRAKPSSLGGLIEGEFLYPDYFAAICTYAMPLLARFGSDEAVARSGLSRERLTALAADVLAAWAGAIEATPSPPRWPIIDCGRNLHGLAMGLWFLHDAADDGLRRRLAAILAREADRFLGQTPWHALTVKSWAEVDAWTGGGLAAVSHVLRRHPHQPQWEMKARELMISAYATEADAASDRVVDGRPLRQWIPGPNAFADHVVENHGFIHPDYLAAFSEMVRAAIAYRLAGDPLPQAVTFNAEACFDRLAFLSLPDATHLYVHGTDYTPRRVDSLFQACALVPLRPTPLRAAILRRCVATLETMAERAPDLPLCGWPGFPHDLGVFWGASQNYLLCRFYGDGGEPLPDERIEAALAGTHVSDGGCFAVRRTARAVSTFSWHDRAAAPLVMGFTMPLDRDVLIDPLPRCLIGELRHADEAGREQEPTLAVLDRQIVVEEDAFAVALVLERCGGLVRQDCACVALPDGRAVYMDRRTALKPVAIARSTVGNMAINDDSRWPFQPPGPRRYAGATGDLAPGAVSEVATRWLALDDRLGFITLGADRLSLSRRPGRSDIFRKPDESMFDTVRVAFGDGTGSGGPRLFAAGDCVGRFAVILCPHQTAGETAALAGRLRDSDWLDELAGGMRIALPPFEVSAVFAPPGTPGAPRVQWLRRDP